MAQDLRFYVVFSSVVVLALLGSERRTATQSSTVEYGVSDLGTIGGNQTIARSISRNGFPRITGSATTAAGDEHAFEGNAHGIQDLGTLGGRTSEALANSDAGTVGRSQVASGAFHAFSYIYPGIVDLGTLGGSESWATAINDSGVIVGASYVSGNTGTRAFVYENGTMSLLPATLGGADVVANDINNNREIVGYAQRTGQPYHAFLYADGLTIDLGSLGGTSEALAINDAGVIVGRSQVPSGASHAFRYENGVMQDLGTLGGSGSQALNINRQGVIVGWSDTAAGQRRAFVWRDGVMTDLNTLIAPGTGWVLEAATGIGDERTGGPPRAGAIVGYGRLNGQVRSFILTPPLDLSVSLTRHPIDTATNFPNPHETGKEMLWGVSVSNSSGLTGTGLTITNTIGGPVEFLGAFASGPLEGCVQTGQQIVCRIGKIDFDRSLFLRVRSTAAGEITYAATVTADQPDPSPANNSGSVSNTAVSLQSLTLDPTTIFGGQLSAGRATLTSRTPIGGAIIPLTSSRPDIAIVPSLFGVLPDANGGLYREFWVTTNTVSLPVTVDISATYGLVTKTVPLTIMPAGGQWPFGDSARQIPGTIQAEHFDEGGEGAAYHDASVGNNGGAYRPADDVDVEPTSDAGGGYNVGWISGGEWLEYTTNVAATGTYTMEARVASAGAGGTFHIEVDGVNKSGTLTVPDTDGWQEWTTVSKALTLDAGLHLVRVSFDTSSSVTGAVGNLNYLRFVATGGPVPTPFGGTPRAIPGTVQAEDFDEGGEGVAYHDAESANFGGAYRTNGVDTGVDIEATSDTGGGYNVGWMTAGEWLNYTVSVTQAGTYTLATRVAASGAGGSFHLEFGGADKTGSMTIPDTEGWQNWITLTRTVTLAAGTQSMRFVADQNGPTGIFGNLNSITLTSAAGAPADIVLYSTELSLNGTWFITGDGSAAGGQKVLTPDAGAPTVAGPASNPANYVEATFDAPANIPYRLWLRLRATGDTKFSESVWVQLSDARANGSAIYPIGSTSGLLVNLEPCNSCGVSGWGWQNGAYWLDQPTTLTFANAGSHTLRIQVREDGAQIDQIVLSPSRYLAAAPGSGKNDATIVAK